MINIISLFDGMSCGQQALPIGLKYKYYAFEIKPHAIKVTQHNYPNTIQCGDVTKCSYKNGILHTEKGNFDIGNVFLFIGGSPCQDFSRGNKERLGLDGVKSGLFEQYLRIKNECNPRYFLLENVIMDNLDMNYISDNMNVMPININSKLVSGQLRNRLYWTNIGEVYKDLMLLNRSCISIPKDRYIKLFDILDDGYCPMNKARCLLESDSRPLATPIKMFHRFYSTGFTTLIFKSEKHYKECKYHYDTNCKNLSADELKDSPVYDGVRYLNQKELERLQTVSNGYTDILTRNEAACLLGDGWTVEVIKWIFSHIKHWNY